MGDWECMVVVAVLSSGAYQFIDLLMSVHGSGVGTWWSGYTALHRPPSRFVGIFVSKVMPHYKCEYSKLSINLIFTETLLRIIIVNKP